LLSGALRTPCGGSGKVQLFGKVFDYESRKRELKKRRKNEYQCDERLKTKAEESTCLTWTGLHEELEKVGWIL
jgi:hypothetical protein